MMNFAGIIQETQEKPIENEVAEAQQRRQIKIGSKATSDLLPILKRFVTEVTPPMEENSYVRMSSIPYLCPREEVLCSMHNVTRERKIKATQSLIFGFGHKAHDLLQLDFFGEHRMLIGWWGCAKCLDRVYGTMPIKCAKCGNDSPIVERFESEDGVEEAKIAPFKFFEEHVIDKKLNYGGHPDGKLLIEGVAYLLEIKSMRGDLFMKLTEPTPEHVEQASGYAELKNLDWVKFVYLNKNGRNESDFIKEFTLRLDREMVDKEIKGKVRLIREGLRDKKPPERTVCITPTSTRAKTCKVRKFCFEDCKK